MGVGFRDDNVRPHVLRSVLERFGERAPDGEGGRSLSPLERAVSGTATLESVPARFLERVAAAAEYFAVQNIAAIERNLETFAEHGRARERRPGRRARARRGAASARSEEAATPTRAPRGARRCRGGRRGRGGRTRGQLGRRSRAQQRAALEFIWKCRASPSRASRAKDKSRAWRLKNSARFLGEIRLRGSKRCSRELFVFYCAVNGSLSKSLKRYAVNFFVSYLKTETSSQEFWEPWIFIASRTNLKSQSRTKIPGRSHPRTLFQVFFCAADRSGRICLLPPFAGHLESASFPSHCVTPGRTDSSRHERATSRRLKLNVHRRNVQSRVAPPARRKPTARGGARARARRRAAPLALAGARAHGRARGAIPRHARRARSRASAAADSASTSAAPRLRHRRDAPAWPRRGRRDGRLHRSRRRLARGRSARARRRDASFVQRGVAAGAAACAGVGSKATRPARRRRAEAASRASRLALVEVVDVVGAGPGGHVVVARARARVRARSAAVGRRRRGDRRPGVATSGAAPPSPCSRARPRGAACARAATLPGATSASARAARAWLVGERGGEPPRRGRRRRRRARWRRGRRYRGVAGAVVASAVVAVERSCSRAELVAQRRERFLRLVVLALERLDARFGRSRARLEHARRRVAAAAARDRRARARRRRGGVARFVARAPRRRARRRRGGVARRRLRLLLVLLRRCADRLDRRARGGRARAHRRRRAPRSRRRAARARRAAARPRRRAAPLDLERSCPRARAARCESSSAARLARIPASAARGRGRRAARAARP